MKAFMGMVLVISTLVALLAVLAPGPLVGMAAAVFIVAAPVAVLSGAALARLMGTRGFVPPWIP